MSQWGQTRSFTTDDGGYIRVTAHVAGPTWAKLAPAQFIDDLLMSHITGSTEIGMAKLTKLRREWIGRTYGEWVGDAEPQTISSVDGVLQPDVTPTVNLFELHEKMTKNLFPAYASQDERFLALALCGEAGELANMIKKRWRDGADLSDEIREEIADIRIYLELIAKCFDIEGEKLDEQVKAKLVKVVEKHSKRLASA